MGDDFGRNGDAHVGGDVGALASRSTHAELDDNSEIVLQQPARLCSSKAHRTPQQFIKGMLDLEKFICTSMIFEPKKDFP